MSRLRARLEKASFLACLFALTVLCAAPTAARLTPKPLLEDDFTEYPRGQEWTEGKTYGPWKVAFDGYGSVSVAGKRSRSLALRPETSEEAAETHATLVQSTDTFNDLSLALSLKTTTQLRAGSPHPAEVGWALWHYTDSEHFYYVALKPNGWELGKEDPGYPGAQRFLATAQSPKFPIGQSNRLQIRQKANMIRVTVNGRLLTTFRDQEEPYLNGAVALYSEDAEAYFNNISVNGL